MEVETGRMNPAALVGAGVGIGGLGQARGGPDKVDQLPEDCGLPLAAAWPLFSEGQRRPDMLVLEKQQKPGASLCLIRSRSHSPTDCLI